MSKCKICGHSEGHAPTCFEHVDARQKRTVFVEGQRGERIAMTEWEMEFHKLGVERNAIELRINAYQYAVALRVDPQEAIATTLQRAKDIHGWFDVGDVPSAEVTKLRAMN